MTVEAKRIPPIHHRNEGIGRPAVGLTCPATAMKIQRACVNEEICYMWRRPRTIPRRQARTALRDSINSQIVYRDKRLGTDASARSKPVPSDLPLLPRRA